MPDTYQSFADLPAEVRAQVESDVMPANPEQWASEPLAALGGRSFLEVLNGPNGEAAIKEYFATVATTETTWRQAADSAIESSTRRRPPSWRWRLLMLTGAGMSFAATAGGGITRLFFTAAALGCFTVAYLSRNP